MNDIPAVTELRERFNEWIESPPKDYAGPYEWLQRNLVGTGVGYDELREFNLHLYTAHDMPAELLEQFQKSPDFASMSLIRSGRFAVIPGGNPFGAPGAGALDIADPVILQAGGSGGVIGAFFTRQGQPCLLSCRHVLDPALAAGNPNVLEQGVPRGPIATLVESSNLAGDASGNNTDDWSLAQLSVGFGPNLPGGLGQLSATPPAVSNSMSVIRAATTPRNGTIQCVNAELDVEVSPGVTRHFVNQLIIEGPGGGKFADVGDSGSLVVTADVDGQGRRSAVGVVFAANRAFSGIPGVPAAVPLTAAFLLDGVLAKYPMIVN